VYVLGSTGDLTCLSAADGKTVWSKNLVTDFGGKVPTWGYSESVLIDGDHVVCTPGSKGGMIALHKKTGETVWQCTEFDDPAGYSSIVAADVGGVRQYVQQTMASGLGVRAKDGKLLWKVGEIGRRTAVIPTPVVYKDHVFFTAGYGAGSELFKLEPDGQNGTKATKVYTNNKLVANHHGGVIRVGEHLYGHSDRVGWVCFDFLKGGDDAEWTSSKLGKGSVSYADGELYCYAEADGTLAKIKTTPEGWDETGRFKIPTLSPTRPGQGKVWAHPVIAQGKLFLRDYEHLYCYDLTGPTN
jgi:outer membrane protein assembly factor BamB